MRIGCYLCRCGPDDDGQVSSCIDVEELASRLRALPDVAHVADVDVACSEAGQEQLVERLRAERPDRVVIAACSPREHGVTFQRVLRQADLNPYLLHLANIREQVAWVTPDPAAALDKAERLIRAGVARVTHQTPLEREEREVNTDVLVIGAGPAGHRATLTLAEAGRRVTLVDSSPIVGGVPVRLEDLFPAMECAPCLLEPLTGDLLHGELPGPIETLLMSDVVDVKGSLGNFTVTVRRRPRYVSVVDCVGCGECVAACPAGAPNPLALGRTERRAVDFELFGGLPSVPVLDPHVCRRFVGTTADDTGCTLCDDACPLDDVIHFDDTEHLEQRAVGAVVVAVGAREYDAGRMPALGHGRHPDILTSWEFERLLAANGPTNGELLTHDGRVPRNVAIVNCAGSLDDEHVPYCSGTCCQVSLKFHHLVTRKSPDTCVTTYYRHLVTPGKEAVDSLRHARAHAGSRWVRYDRLDELRVRVGNGLSVERRVQGHPPERTEADLVVLMMPVVPGEGLRDLAEVLDIGLHPTGFLQELNGRVDTTSSTTRGIFLAGSCQAPMDLPSAMTQGVAAAGKVLATLVEGRTLLLEAATAAVDQDRCSGCLSCLLVCPSKAVDRTGDDTVSVDPALCTGCGTCVASCPAGAILGRHFTDEAIFAEIQGVLR